MTTNNITNIKNCFGCGVCSKICPIKIIDLKLNPEGFYTPFITNNDQCIHCGLCRETCAYINTSTFLKPLKSYAAWSTNDTILHDSSSGGICYMIANKLQTKGYDICAVKFNPIKNRAEHYIAHNNIELQESLGSKYIQSYTIAGFRDINLKKNTLVVGTPCQIDSFRHLIIKRKVEDNFILIDFFCHGIPSWFLWNKYVKELSLGKLKSASWRNKDNGWHDSWLIKAEGEKGEIASSYKKDKDMFYKLFLSDTCLNKPCYISCKYKQTKSAADIRVGDFWGKTYSQNDKGVSIVITYNDKGNNILKELSDCTLKEHPIDICLEGQMSHNPTLPKTRSLIIKELKNKYIPIRYILFRMKISHKFHIFIKRLIKHENKNYNLS